MAENMSHESTMYVAPNPETHFEELFRVVQQNANNSNNNNQQSTNVPMRQRNFPDSFFRPPSSSSSASHSRDSSLDASFNSNFIVKNISNPSNSAKPPATPIQSNSSHRNGRHVSPSPPFVHQKAHSLPASLSNQKLVTSSIINLDDNNSKNSVIISQQQTPPPPPPPQQYRHQQLKLPNHNITNSNNNNFHFRQQSYDIDKIPLPNGWSMSFDSNGERYFIDHKHKITTWDDPRIKITQQNFTTLAQTSNSNINHPVPFDRQSQQQIQPKSI
ncbi:Yes-associated protein 1-like protein, partial [Euroglyphus maynei]